MIILFNGLISDDEGIPVVTNCKADPCTNNDDGATCCADMNPGEPESSSSLVELSGVVSCVVFAASLLLQ